MTLNFTHPETGAKLDRTCLIGRNYHNDYGVLQPTNQRKCRKEREHKGASLFDSR